MHRARCSQMLRCICIPNRPTLTAVDPVVTGSDVTVECRTNGSRPAANISWAIRGETLTGANVVTSDNTTQTFITASVLQKRVTSAENGQSLTCKVSHLTGEQTSATTLNIQFAVPSSSTRISGNNAIVANGSNILSLTCTTGSSNPASAITWKKGSSIINGDSPYSEQAGENYGIIRSQVLTLRPTRDDNGDTVTCSVSNVVSSLSDSASVTLSLLFSPLINTLTDKTIVEEENIVLKCTAISRPSASFSWARDSETLAQGTGTSSYNGLDYTITTVSRTQAGTYTCTADNQIPPNNLKQMRLVVQYPPDVVVTAINTTVHNQSATLTCAASGVPDQYTYDHWVHTFNGVQVLHSNPLPASRELTLTGLSYAHSGVYRCGASNGVKSILSHGEGSLLVQSYPILIGNVASSREIKASVKLMVPTVVTFQYYSNDGSGSVKVLKSNDTGKNVGDILQRRVDIRLPVFLSKITTFATEVTINITVMKEDQFGEYQVIVTNTVGYVMVSLVLQPLGPPDTPLYVNSEVLDHHSVMISWVPGLPNGLNQTFIIQLSTDNSTWRNITKFGGMSTQQAHLKRVDNLASSQEYFWRMLAVNGVGESQPTGIFTFETTDATATCTSYSSGAQIGGAFAGGLVGALGVVAVGVFVWRKRCLTSSGENKSSESDKMFSRTEEVQLDDRHNEGHVRGAVMNKDSTTIQPYETLSAMDDARYYEQLQTNRTADPPGVYDNTGTSPYEGLQMTRQDNTQPYEQLHHNVPGHNTKMYENLKVSSM